MAFFLGILIYQLPLFITNAAEGNGGETIAEHAEMHRLLRMESADGTALFSLLNYFSTILCLGMESNAGNVEGDGIRINVHPLDNGRSLAAVERAQGACLLCARHICAGCDNPECFGMPTAQTAEIIASARRTFRENFPDRGVRAVHEDCPAAHTRAAENRAQTSR